MLLVAIKDSNLESRIYGVRTVAVVALVLLLLVLLLLRYFLLQIVEYDIYRAESDRNRVQLQTLPSQRGVIYDRYGRLLATNLPSHVLSVVVERTDGLEETLRTLSSLVAISDSDLEKFHERVRHRRPYEAVPLHFRLNEEELARLAVDRHHLPGVVVEAQLVRHYPQGAPFSHAVGYVGRINEREQAELDETRYRGVSHIGKIGLEKHYQDILHGQVGYQNVETNALGRVLRVLERTDPVAGVDLTLTLDSEVQRAAYKALAGRRGAVVAMDPWSGDVLAMVSTPGFNSNLFVNGISEANYSVLRDSINLPLFNRAIQGQYPPGSTVKPMFALAGLEHGVVTPESTINDPGWYKLPSEERRFRDWTLRVRGTGHGPAVDMHQAIAESCDVYFYDLSYRLGIDRMVAFATPFGLGAVTGLDTAHEQAGLLPSREWKERTRGEIWFPGDTLNVGIGQGRMLATPLQLAVMASTIATRGRRHSPRLVWAVDGTPGEPPDAVRVRADDSHWELLHRAMRDVFHSEEGSAWEVGAEAPVTMAGKSGTAQVVGIAQDEVYDAEKLEELYRDHSLFIAFAPFGRPEIAVAVVVENGGGGSRVAAPVARKVIETYLGGEADET